MIQTIDLSRTLVERAAAIMRLKSCGMALNWLKEYPIPCLLDTCTRKEQFLPGAVMDATLERELILNRAFAGWYAQLLPLVPEDPPAEPKPAYPAYRGQSRSNQPPSRRAAFQTALREFVEVCNIHGKDITNYSQNELAGLLEQDWLTSYTRLVFLENFTPAELPDNIRQNVIASLRNCSDLPLELDEQQKALLVEPFTATRHLFGSAPFPEICQLLDAQPELLDIIKLLHENQIQEELSITDYRSIAQNASEHHQLLEGLISRVGTETAGMFMQFWQKSGCPLYELRTIAAQTSEHPELDWSERLSTYAGYVNQLYKTRFKQIHLCDVSAYQENILIYAIVHNKKHFIRLVDANAEQFLKLPSMSILLLEELYQEHFNLNELTEKDLLDCAWMVRQKLGALSPGRRYTFHELRALYGVPTQYNQFYHLLQSQSQDYRLKVFQQLYKRDILQRGTPDDELAVLAGRLDSKPLDAWIQTDFGHIPGLTASDAAQMLVHMDSIEPVLPSIQTRTDVMLVLHNLDALKQYKTLPDLKANLMQSDESWHFLAERMGLTPEFLKQNQEHIVSFLCNDGAYIAETYLRGISGRQEESFLRVVKAELMGQLPTLKYFEGDLQRELDSPLTVLIRTGWSRNLHLESNHLKVQEYDDFFSTMLLGERPHWTCLNYANGGYKGCLLSAFDSNKKILYATLDGRVVGRAFLRLTKGRLTGANTPVTDGFTFVDLENIRTTRPESHKEAERLTLFLERPYISGVGPKMEQTILSMFVKLAEQKADELDTLLVLSEDYRIKNISGFTLTRYAIYISKSKAGSQYLDSLGGQATVNTEGSYSTGNFLVRGQEGYALAG